MTMGGKPRIVAGFMPLLDSALLVAAKEKGAAQPAVAPEGQDARERDEQARVERAPRELERARVAVEHPFEGGEAKRGSTVRFGWHEVGPAWDVAIGELVAG